MPCHITIHACAGRRFTGYLRERVPEAVRRAQSGLAEVSIVLVGDRRMSALHKKFFGDPATTDVITFPLELDGRGRARSGELYLCVPMAKRQAKLRAVAVTEELLLYAVHGILHLVGYDDLDEHGYTEMHQKEDRILKAMGIGAVFARGRKR